MKHTIKLFIASLLFCSTFLSAQKNGHLSFSKVRALKVNFISTELDLTPEEAEKFWVLYNEYEKQNKLLKSVELTSIKQEVDSAGDVANLSDEKAKQLANKFIGIDSKRVRNKKAFFKKLESFLPPKKILKLHLAEINFNQSLLKRLRKKKS
ncbi:hypothetical protein [Flavicella sediminum]|uniref:hypothetical protein n=1 Tax=Flavicella sediminum TaxID=2585141 RepID=UPI00111CAE5C|nr:hypothetical protein [Flavicella sediminum]